MRPSRAKPDLLMRMPCTCRLDVTPRVICAACAAWDKKQVLLPDGTTLHQTLWLLLNQAAPDGDKHTGKEAPSDTHPLHP